MMTAIHVYSLPMAHLSHSQFWENILTKFGIKVYYCQSVEFKNNILLFFNFTAAD